MRLLFPETISFHHKSSQKKEGKMKENKRKTIRKEVISKKRKDETERDDIAVFIWKTMCLLMGER